MDETGQLGAMMAYAAQLELEVDRLRRRDQFLTFEANCFCKEILAWRRAERGVDDSGNAKGSVSSVVQEYSQLLADIRKSPGYYAAFDPVIAVAVRPLAEGMFRWHQRITGALDTQLRMDLDEEHIDWFPARLRHILDNLFSNALRFRDPHKGEMRVGLQLQTRPNGYEFRFTDNGLGMPMDKASGMLEIFYRAAPAQPAGLGVGLAVVKFLVEQCCGTIAVQSGQGQGTDVTVLLPRFALHDHLESQYLRERPHASN